MSACVQPPNRNMSKQVFKIIKGSSKSSTAWERSGECFSGLPSFLGRDAEIYKLYTVWTPQTFTSFLLTLIRRSAFYAVPETRSFVGRMLKSNMDTYMLLICLSIYIFIHCTTSIFIYVNRSLNKYNRLAFLEFVLQEITNSSKLGNLTTEDLTKAKRQPTPIGNLSPARAHTFFHRVQVSSNGGG